MGVVQLGTIFFLCLTLMCIESRVLLEYTEESNPDAAVEDSPSAQEGDEQVYDSEGTNILLYRIDSL